MSAELSPQAFKATLDNCAREPIHIPGAIQSSGALVAFEPAAGTILHASVNLGQWLPVGSLPINGRALSDLIGDAAYQRIASALAGRAGGPVRHEVVDLSACGMPGQAGPLMALVHSHRGVCFAEFEPAAAVESAANPAANAAGKPAGDWQQGLNDTIDALRGADGLEDLYERMAQRVKRLTGFDRVMVYRFDDDHNGHVIADARESGMESFYDLHYPASDIPAQARDLYVSNLVRYLPDVSYQPVAVLPWLAPTTLQPLDMSHAMLRSVSPMHIQYLRNMGVASTLTLSLVIDGRLWGLIACHHRTATALPLRLRRACYSLSITAGYMTGWFIGQARAAAAEQTTKALAAVVEAFNQVQVPLQDVVEHASGHLQRMVTASGGAFWRGDEVLPFGQWPLGERGDSILSFVRREFEASQSLLIDTDHAQLLPPLDPAELRTACGLLALKFDGFASSGLVWLRPEHRFEVRWGGDPDKPVQLELDAAGQVMMSPRNSFASWTTLVQGRCRPWTAQDRQAASALGLLKQVLVVRDSLAQVSLSDRQFRSLVALQSDAYWQTDLQGRISTLSKRLPFPHGPLVGLPMVDVLAEACGDEGVAALRSALASLKPFRGLRLSGQGELAVVLQINGEPLRDLSGAAAGWHGTLSDLSHEVAIERALRQQMAAELASQTKSKFLAQVNHELRTPLVAVLGYSNLVIRADSTPEKQREQVRRVHKAGTWLLAMITDLLDLARIDSGGFTVRMEDIDLRDTCAEVMTLVALPAAEHSISFVGPEPGAPCLARADPDRLRQALSNLCTNAIKYNRPAGEASLSIQQGPDEDHVRIVVTDTGAGLSPEQIEHLFEPFNRLGRESLDVSGTGIGLNLAKALVDLMGGRIEVSSTPGAGSRFAIVLRRSDAALADQDR